MLDLWLVRHGESLGNLDGSDADTGLSARGRLQAAALAGVIADQAFDRSTCRRRAAGRVGQDANRIVVLDDRRHVADM
jgi:broad specificity phosphatase PhoE